MSVDFAEIETGKSKLTSKCQTTIPMDIREKIGVGPNDTVKWIWVNGELKVKKAVED